MSRRLQLAVLLLLAAAPARAAEVLYARSNGEMEAKKHPGRYSSLNLLDADPATAWCSAGTGRGAKIEFVFDEAFAIDRMDIANGNQSTAENFTSFSRVKSVQIVLPDMSHSIKIKNMGGIQTFNFDPPLQSRQLVLRLTGGYRGKQRHACISDVIFYQNKKPIGGKQLKEPIQKILPHFAFIDTWVAGPEYTRNRELVLSLHGTFHYLFVPDDPAEPTVKSTGRWRTQGEGLELTLEKKAFPVEVRRDDAGRVLKLRIEEQEGLPQGMDQVYVRR